MNGKENLKNYLVRVVEFALVSLVVVSVDAKLRERGVVATNVGMAFGIAFWGLRWWRLLWLVPLTVLYVVKGGTGLLLMVAGGVANLISGIVYGGVGDYWTIPYTQLHNNLPDWFIFIGFLVAIWTEIRRGQKSK